MLIKTSGAKGLRLYISLPDNQLSYEQAGTLRGSIGKITRSAKDSDLFTIERMKKNRQERLYIDYVQFGWEDILQFHTRLENGKEGYR